MFLQVYGGKEDCKTIYVDNCILKEVPEVIKVEKPHCSVEHKAPYMTIETKKDVKTVYKMECKVNNFVSCFIFIIHSTQKWRQIGSKDFKIGMEVFTTLTLKRTC